MRHFKKIDWSISLFLFFACVLTVIAACVAPSGPLGAPNVIQLGAISSVRLTLAQSTLAPGQTTQATAVATSADGTVVGGRVDFSSQNPSIATVSSNGLVTALTAGVSMIEAAAGSRAASATLTVQSLVSPVDVVAVVLDSTSLAIGHSAKASATVMDSAGNLIVGQTVTWASLSPTVATVSSDGSVTAVTAGSATIQGSVSGKVGTASVTVRQVSASIDSILAFHDFNDGTSGPFTDFGVPAIDYPDDPTGSGRGKVARILYTGWKGDPASNDENIVLNTAHHFRYGETVWFKGDVYFPSAVVSGGPQNYNNTRKMIDFGLAFPYAPRLIIERNSGGLSYFVCQIEDDHLYHTDITIGNTGFFLSDDTWYTIEVMYKLNSADGVKDGVLDIYVNNSSATPSFHLATGIFPITEGVNGGTTAEQAVFDAGGGYFNSFRFGTQLTISYPTDPLYSQYRYWDNVGLSTARMGR